jgi:hypothetical protein
MGFAADTVVAAALEADERAERERLRWASRGASSP